MPPQMLVSLESDSLSTPATSRSADIQVLSFGLTPETTALLPIHNLVEILKIPCGQLAPIAHMPTWVMGVCNWRGEILWMLDLANLLGLSSGAEDRLQLSYHTTLVLEVVDSSLAQGDRQTLRLGLIVPRLGSIQSLNPERIQSPPATAVTAAMAPFLQGYWITETGDILNLLDVRALFSRLPKTL